jgi:NhaP-type Na+/H+ or K+/H+ antiporter
MLFVAFGLLVGPKALDGIDVAGTSSVVRALAEATLALVLFSDAARIDLGALRRAADVPVRLLGIGLPLTIHVPESPAPRLAADRPMRSTFSSKLSPYLIA